MLASVSAVCLNHRRTDDRLSDAHLPKSRVSRDASSGRNSKPTETENQGETVEWQAQSVPWVDEQGAHFEEVTIARPDGLASVTATSSEALTTEDSGTEEEAENRVIAVGPDQRARDSWR